MDLPASDLQSVTPPASHPAQSAEKGQHHIRATVSGQLTADRFAGQVPPRRQMRREAAERKAQAAS